jgi:hypothetical protein
MAVEILLQTFLCNYDSEIELLPSLASFRVVMMLSFVAARSTLAGFERLNREV